MKNVNFFQIFQRLTSEFTLKNWQADLFASLSVFLVAIPLCLGIAHASNVPLLSGLIAGIIGALVVGTLSGSPLSVSGPAAGLTAVIASAVLQLPNLESLMTAILIAGLIQIIFGLIRAGTFGRYIPSSVIEGMLAGIGITLILKQLPHFIGYDIEAAGLENFSLHAHDFIGEPSQTHENTFSLLWQAIDNIHLPIFALGLLALLVILFWDKFFVKHYPKIHRMVPSSLLAVFMGTGLALIYANFIPSFTIKATHLVQIPLINCWNDFTSKTYFPSLKVLFNPAVYKVAFTIAFVASIESILSIEAIDKLDPQHRKTSVNRELLAQGLGNMFSGLLGGLPITSVIVRSTVNLTAGAKTKLSTIFHGVFLLLTVFFAAKIINHIPLTILSTILMLTGYKLASPQVFKRLFLRGPDQFIPFIATIMAILLSDLMIGVLIGVAVSSVFILRDHYHSSVLKIYNRGKITEIVLGENLTFLNKQQVIEALEALPCHAKVLIDGSKTHYIDNDILEVLREFSDNAHHKQIEILIGGLPQMHNDQSLLAAEFKESYQKLLDNNKEWVDEKKKDEGSRFFKDMAEGQSPQFLFVGCSDSRVPIEILTKANPGDIFVHRNIANTVSLTDANFLSVLEYAVKVLRVKNIVVCGHYECGGVKAALSGDVEGVIGHWISQIKDVYRLYESTLNAIADPQEREHKLIELNVIEQVKKIQKTLLVQQAFATFGFPNLHGWVYDIKTGLIRELTLTDTV